VQKGQIVGNLQVKIGDKVVETVNIVTIEKIDKKNPINYLLDMLAKYSSL